MNRFFLKAALIIFTCSFLISSPVFCSDASLGVGISATEQGGTIYLPIRIPHLMIEPMFSYSSGETQNESEYDYVNQNDYSEYSVGLGVYLVKSIFQIRIFSWVCVVHTLILNRKAELTLSQRTIFKVQEQRLTDS
ncbi:MAG: hypothetical protein WC799_07640 [Desulfobacteraceae bacterium]